MPFKINATGQNLANIYDRAHKTVYRLYNVVSEYKYLVDTSTVPANQVVDMFNSLVSYSNQLASIQGTPGIGAYAKTMVDDVNYDIASEFNTVINTIAGAIIWIHSNYPKSASDYWEVFQTDISGNYTYREFTPAQLTGLSGQFTNILNTIEVE